MIQQHKRTISELPPLADLSTLKAALEDVLVLQLKIDKKKLEKLKLNIIEQELNIKKINHQLYMIQQHKRKISELPPIADLSTLKALEDALVLQTQLYRLLSQLKIDKENLEKFKLNIIERELNIKRMQKNIDFLSHKKHKQEF